ncbi:MAG: hypothetical protein J5739_05250 [Lachnospiraceae bacterium]|nr:hypothetical protein [Lachnospiraceae bacterium]
MSNDGYNSYGPHDLLEYARESREGREDHACKNCGQMLAENAQRCPICGTPVDRKVEPYKEKNKKWTGWIWFAILSCLTAVFALYLFFNKTQEKNAVEESLSKMTKEYNIVNAELVKVKGDCSTQEARIEELKTSIGVLQENYDGLKTEYDNLLNDSRGWYNLTDADRDAWIKWSEDEKAAELARAETDRINAEKELKKLKEEEEKKAAEEKAKQEAEEKKGYETGYTYTDLARRPDDYIGKKDKFKGEVLQVLESSWSDKIDIRLATKKNSWGGYSDDVIYIHFNKSLISERILEEDIITIYGVAEQLKSYTSIFGSTITLPMVKVDKIELNK